MIDLENKEERNKLIDDFFNKGLECNIKEVYQAVVNTVADLEYEDVKKTKEIERLNENNQAMQEEMARTWKKLDEKENIIKEVREYIKNHREAVDEREHILYFLKDDFDEEDILKILERSDKDGNNEGQKV